MARGRMISNSLSTSEKFAQLSSKDLGEFCQALYPLIVAHSDDFGRLQGDPFTVKAKCYPASPRSLDEFKAALMHLDGVGLIVWYVVEGKRYIQIANFERHQSGLHKRTRSMFPRVTGISGNDPELPDQEKGIEENGIEGKGTKGKKGSGAIAQPVRPAFEVYRRHFVARYHGKPEYAGAKDGARMSKLLKAHGLDEVTRRLDAFFSSGDAWIQNSGHTLDVFFAAGTQTKLVAERGRRTAAEACARCGAVPKCQSFTECRDRALQAARRPA